MRSYPSTVVFESPVTLRHFSESTEKAHSQTKTGCWWLSGDGVLLSERLGPEDEVLEASRVFSSWDELRPGTAANGVCSGSLEQSKCLNKRSHALGSFSKSVCQGGN